ncbi:site-specific integrase [Vreelandella alkaliphila]|uniref:Integrase n=1 Tax=Vreelandella alkaliphila TaxID=272774 RepID=A0ABX4HIZ9_9GAMM|nr:site-specific integrase [Halomonas humidisoli]PAU72444.1 integrase [Halomonas humidisoli]
MIFKIKHFIAADGERFSQLYNGDSTGFPLYYPTSYIARSVRPSVTHETQKVHLEAIKRVCEWEALQNISIAVRFQGREYLRQFEIDGLVRHITASRRSGKGEVISRNKANTYIAYAANYLRWLADETITELNSDIKTAIDKQHEALLSSVARKSGSSPANKQRILAMRLPDEAAQALRKLFEEPLHCVQKNGDKGPRIRNILMLRILYETGMRRGELLSLKLGNFMEAISGESAQLRIERNHHDEFDSRAQQPVAKTLGRTVNISTEAEQQLIAYRDHWRPNSDCHFLFINHRAGRTQGRPVTMTGFYSALNNLKEVFPALAPLYPHLLRHDWNYRFSQKADMERMDFESERTIREMLMGWTPNSEMSLLYNQRHIQERANEIGREIASDTINRGDKKCPAILHRQ